MNKARASLAGLAMVGLLAAGCGSDDGSSSSSPFTTTGQGGRPGAPPATTVIQAPVTAPERSAPKAAPPAPAPAIAYNPWVQTLADPQSTFAVDVDTGSYTLARASLERNQPPERSTVRPEEFVNYFEQGYRRPTDRGFAINVDGTANPFETTATGRTLRVGLSTRESSPSTRPAADITLVIDVSGSMADRGKMDLVKRSMRAFVATLRNDDTVAIVTYSTDARLALNFTSGRDKERIYGVIDQLRPDSSTNVEAGLKLGYQIAGTVRSEDRINRVILASDGVANTGNTSPDAILATVRDFAARKINLLAVGYGFGVYNDPLLERLADGGNGWYVYVDDEAESQRLFVDRFQSTIDVVALDAKIQVEFDASKVRQYRLIGFENRAVADTQFRNDTIDAGEVGAGHTVTALYEIELAPGAPSGSLGTVRVRWADARTRQVAETHAEIDRSAIVNSFSEASPRLQNAVLVGWAADVLRGSPYATDVRLSALAPRAADMAKRLEDTDVAEWSKLLAHAAAIAR